MSASLEGLLVDDNLNDNNYTQSSEHLVITENEIVAAEVNDSIRRELVIVDTDTPDFQFLLDDLLNQQTSERQFDVLLLDNNQNGIDQITAALSNYQNLDAIHIVSDGNNGNIDLGNTTLSYNNIDVYSGDIASWSNVLAIVEFSGTVYQADGGPNIGAGATITLLVNGIDLGNVTTGTNGDFTFSENVNINETVLIYINSNDGAYQSTLVTELNTLANLTGLDLIDDTLTVRSDNGGTLTNTEMWVQL